MGKLKETQNQTILSHHPYCMLLKCSTVRLSHLHFMKSETRRETVNQRNTENLLVLIAFTFQQYTSHAILNRVIDFK